MTTGPDDRPSAAALLAASGPPPPLDRERFQSTGGATMTSAPGVTMTPAPGSEPRAQDDPLIEGVFVGGGRGRASGWRCARSWAAAAWAG
jgi:hypothetical protein